MPPLAHRTPAPPASLARTPQTCQQLRRNPAPPDQPVRSIVMAHCRLSAASADACGPPTGTSLMQANAQRQEHAASLWHSQSSKDVSGEHILTMLCLSMNQTLEAHRVQALAVFTGRGRFQHNMQASPGSSTHRVQALAVFKVRCRERADRAFC